MDRIPEHVAIIMDGNGRWAKSKGHMRLFGHRHGVKTVREVIEAARDEHQREQYARDKHYYIH